MRSVYVPVDGSVESQNALPLASTIARALGASMVVVHASEESASAGDLLESLKIPQRCLHDAILAPLRGAPGESVARVASENPGSMIVMAMHRQEGPEAGLGPICAEVLQKASCPVMMVPPGRRWEDWKLNRMLLPQDSTAPCARAIHPAMALASTFQSRLTVLHVPIYSEAILAGHSAFPIPRFLDQPGHELTAWKEEFIERLYELAGIPRQINTELVVGMASPLEEILKWERKLDPDLIVLSWEGDLERANVLKPLLASARCPVMVLPARDVGARARNAA